MMFLGFVAAILSFGVFHTKPLTHKKGKLKNRRLSCQSFSEILQIFEVWYESHHYLNWLFKIKGISLKLKIQKQFPFRLSVSLPQGWIQEIKRMLLIHLTHGLFLT
jgi:hypothetical protein